MDSLLFVEYNPQDMLWMLKCQKVKVQSTGSLRIYHCLLAHPVPVHPNAHAHTLGLVQVPPLAHVGEHTAETI